MKISIESNTPIKENFLVGLAGNRIDFKLDEHFSIDEGWYELNLPYTGQRTEIKDVKLNDESIEHTLYTGYYMDGNGTQHQPAAAMWDDGGVMKLWIHTKLGVFLDRVFTEIDGGDFGKNLYKKYVFTVDRPCVLQNEFPESIKSYLASGDGPHWWKKDTDYTPYRILDIETPAVDDIIDEMDAINERDITGAFRGVMDIKTNSPTKSDLPFLEMDWSKAPKMKELLMDKVGYKNILSISMQTLYPKSHLFMHRDDHYSRKKYSVIRGCKKFYWPLKGDWSKNHFKLGKAGVVPFKNRPCLINTLEHTHTAVNDSDEPRSVLIVYGDLPGDILGPGDQRDDK